TAISRVLSRWHTPTLTALLDPLPLLDQQAGQIIPALPIGCEQRPLGLQAREKEGLVRTDLLLAREAEQAQSGQLERVGGQGCARMGGALILHPPIVLAQPGKLAAQQAQP